MPSVLDAFIQKDPKYAEARNAMTASGQPFSLKDVFIRADGLAPGAREKLKPMLEEAYAPAKYDEAAKKFQEPGSMGGLNSMYQGQGQAWYNYYSFIESEMKKGSTKQKSQGGRRRRKTRRSHRSKSKTRGRR